MQNQMREKMLEKLLEFFQNMPDKEESSEMPMGEASPKGVKVEMLSLGKDDDKTKEQEIMNKFKDC